MTEQEMIDLINDALAEEFELEPEDMTAEANLYEDLGLDSLDAVDMVVVLEQAFSFKIREDQAVREIRTLGDIYQFVARKLHDQEAN